MTATQESIDAIILAAQAAESKQATQLNAYDVSEIMGLIDGFLIVSASNERLVDAIVDEVEDQLREQKDLKPIRREGKSGGRWVLLDFGDIVVHVQHEEERAFYALDRLWADAPRIPLGVENEVEEVGELPEASELAPEPKS
ncbi:MULTISPECIES: ribosome silencing factor [Micrococcales]|uniref:ribosome silencing factor n=1 Tax=Micrococcales TaxID=85006 RepID=UPI000568A7BA|nr:MULTISPECIES: ribosome silencing factor [Micrococcales]